MNNFSDFKANMAHFLSTLLPIFDDLSHLKFQQRQIQKSNPKIKLFSHHHVLKWIRKPIFNQTRQQTPTHEIQRTPTVQK